MFRTKTLADRNVKRPRYKYNALKLVGLRLYFD